MREGISNPGKIPSYILNNPVEVASYPLEPLFNSFLLPSQTFLNHRFGMGENIFNTDWDLLIVLDCCRSDAINELEEEYDFINEPSSIFSVGGRTTEWMTNTFTKKYKREIKNTAYITNAPGAVMVFENRFKEDHYGEEITNPKNLRVKKFGNKKYVNDHDFGHLMGIYKTDLECQSCINAEGKKTNARALTNYAINLDRKETHDRVVLHYIIPHYPFYATRSSTGNMARASELYENINILEERRDETWGAYLDNIRWALEEVSLLLNNMGREKVVITSDHGMSFSNFRNKTSSGSFNPKIRKVPWIVTSATDKQTHLPDSIVPDV